MKRPRRSTATAIAIVNFRPRLIINQGTAGAAVPDLKLFDIVVGEATVDYGAFRSAHADAGAGVDLSRWTPVPHRLRLDGKDRAAFDRFPGDSAAVAAALGIPNPRGRVVKGMEWLSTIPRGTGAMGFYERPEQYVPIRSLRLASEVPVAEREKLEVLRTDTVTFSKLVESRRNRSDDWYKVPAGHVDLCNVPLVTRPQP